MLESLQDSYHRCLGDVMVLWWVMVDPIFAMKRAPQAFLAQEPRSSILGSLSCEVSILLFLVRYLAKTSGKIEETVGCFETNGVS